MYPTWLYHASEAPRLVPDARAHEALGEGWRDSPAHFHEHGELAEGATHCAVCGLAREHFATAAEQAAPAGDPAALLSRAEMRSAKRAAKVLNKEAAKE